MRFGVVVFPGTYSHQDCFHALGAVLEQDVTYVWHKDAELPPLDCVVLPGGFSYGDYLRCGAIARFSPVMAAISRFAQEGGHVMGICNGFQVLCEAGLLPGALLRNEHLEFRCDWVSLQVENPRTRFSAACDAGQVLSIPISHGEGRYHADPEVLDEMEQRGQVVFRYCDPQGKPTPESNPNGSLHNIAGIVNREGNVLGMMPHPERACEALLGGEDGALLFRSLYEAR